MNLLLTSSGAHQEARDMSNELLRRASKGGSLGHSIFEFTRCLTRSKCLPPLFLAPSLGTDSSSRSQFSTSSPIHHRRRKGDNTNRGVSALRRTGLRFPVGMSKYPLPQPVLDPKRRSKIEVNEKHGLWGFFNEKRTLLTEPSEEKKFGT